MLSTDKSIFFVNINNCSINIQCYINICHAKDASNLSVLACMCWEAVHCKEMMLPLCRQQHNCTIQAYFKWHLIIFGFDIIQYCSCKNNSHHVKVFISIDFLDIGCRLSHNHPVVFPVFWCCCVA